MPIISKYLICNFLEYAMAQESFVIIISEDDQNIQVCL